MKRLLEKKDNETRKIQEKADSGDIEILIAGLNQEEQEDIQYFIECMVDSHIPKSLAILAVKSGIDPSNIDNGNFSLNLN